MSPTDPTRPAAARPAGAGEHLDPVAVARGFLAVALQRCEACPDAALAICAAWDELEVPGVAPVQVDADIPDVFPADVILGLARNVLYAAIFTIVPAERAFALAWAIRHLDTAVAHLTGELATSGGDHA